MSTALCSKLSTHCARLQARGLQLRRRERRASAVMYNTRLSSDTRVIAAESLKALGGQTRRRTTLAEDLEFVLNLNASADAAAALL